ncbi:uracil-DNA glycosylase [Blastopirellula marina]|uniref:Type-4 uracil-DNA glycosylase n=1 Tax=Blastopirellula marina TaxID=124 RepID=A0A2S8F7C4_9BACT|nr:MULTISPECIES: uracil-DNA glycosylase [Pirellulaceae]PQO28055.1 uracil-DNA glycosylase [Blastopirellula marina]RCS48480.1 uracil-DNA glycosylase [Bremerella cremea]
MDEPEIRRVLLQQAQAWRSSGVQFLARQAALELPSTPVASPPNEPEMPVTQGVSEMPKPKKTETISAAKPAVKPAAMPVLPSSSDEPWPAAYAKLSAAKRQEELDQLRATVAGCTLCAELAKTRTQTVFGVGSPKARIAFFGEAPGADEDRLGEPFVGRAGKLLTQIIEACTFQREDVYILNTLKCRPPGNRNPTTEENENCRPYFERQLEIVQPEYIVCLGRFAISNLLQSTAPIGKLRGQFHPYRGSKVVVTYHPAYLLRNPSAKKDVWEDMKMMLKDMGVAIPKPAK